MKPERIKEVTGKQLTKELHDELLGFNGNTLVECTKDHRCSFDSGLSVRSNDYKVGQQDRLKYTFFKLETYSNWKIMEVK